MKLSTEKATIADIPLLQKLSKEVFYETYKNAHTNEEIDYMYTNMYNTETLTKEITGSVEYFIVSKDTTPCGYFSVEKEATLCNLHKIYVVLQYQHQHIGNYMMERIFEWAKQHNCDTIELQVNKINPAIEFYKKHHFDIEKEFNENIGNNTFMYGYYMSTHF